MKNIRTYEELSKLKTRQERFEYLKLDGRVGEETFGSKRQVNQWFYHNNKDWQRIRREVIVRDYGCDMGIAGYEIDGKIIVHHMNPITLDDLINRPDYCLDPNYLISVSEQTHNSIHYGLDNTINNEVKERTKDDTKLW